MVAFEQEKEDRCEFYYTEIRKNCYICSPFRLRNAVRGYLDVAQLVAHLVRDQEVEGSSPFIQTKRTVATNVTVFLLLLRN